MDIKSLRKLFREEYGNSSVRQNRASITITLHDTLFAEADACASSINFILRQNKIDSLYSVVAVNHNRVRLIENTQTFAEANGDLFAASTDVPQGVEDENGNIVFDIDNDEGLDNESEGDDDYIESIVRSITSTVDTVHEQTQLDNLRLKSLEREVKEFVTGCCEALDRDGTIFAADNIDGLTISVKDLTAVLGYVFVVGKMSNACMADLDLFQTYIEKHS